MGTENRAPQKKTALVVDDSKLARYVLKEMLLAQGIHVETAESAEEALGSLSAWKPDVIFMDHMMPGMDGFQALQAIKTDPKTAMIPIMMYTSKDGGVYVSQARALGAVGVLPKKLKPVQLEQVLQKLKLIPIKTEEPIQTKPTPIEIPAPSADAKSIGQSSLEELALSASEELEKDSMRHLFRQLFNEQRDSIKQDQHELVASLTAQVTPVILASQKKGRWRRMGFYCGVVAAMSLLALTVNRLTVDSLEAQMRVMAQLNNQEALFSAMAKKIDTLPQNNVMPVADKTSPTGVHLDAFEWAINQHFQLPYRQDLNSPKNVDFLNQVFQFLSDSQFKGLVLVKYHSGSFCELTSPEGRFYLPSSEMPVTSCQRTAFDALDRDQLGIPEFERQLALVADYSAGIDVRFETMGEAFTLLDYPDIAFDPTAGDWNRVAAMNNRLEFELLPNEPARQASLLLIPQAGESDLASN